MLILVLLKLVKNLCPLLFLYLWILWRICVGMHRYDVWVSAPILTVLGQPDVTNPLIHIKNCFLVTVIIKLSDSTFSHIGPQQHSNHLCIMSLKKKNLPAVIILSLLFSSVHLMRELMLIDLQILSCTGIRSNSQHPK